MQSDDFPGKEKKVDIIQEILVGDKEKELYFFSNYFKSNSNILDCIVRKYKSEKKGVLKKNVAFYSKAEIESDTELRKKRVQQVNDVNKLLQKRIENSQVLAMCEVKDAQFLVTKDVICYQDIEGTKEIEKIENLRRADKKKGIIKICGMMFFKGKLPLPFCELVNELIVLKIDFQLIYNLHPLTVIKKGWDRANSEEKEKLIRCMLYLICSSGEIFAEQIIRLEAVSRSLYLSSNFLLSEIKHICEMSPEECIEKFYTELSEKREYLILLYHELITLQWLGHDIDFGRMKQVLQRRISMSRNQFNQLDKLICSNLDNIAAWRALQKEVHDDDRVADLFMPIQMQKEFDDKLHLNFIGGKKYGEINNKSCSK